MTEPIEILLVEDYEPDVQLLFTLLKKHRITNKVHVIDNGADALDFLFCRGAYGGRSSERPPAAVLLDIRIPKVDGWEILRQVKEDPKTRDIPVVMTSGSLFPQEIERSLEFGANGCMEKPIKLEGLRSLFNNLGFSWSLIVSELPKKN
jgi:two-component system response regulator